MKEITDEQRQKIKERLQKAVNLLIKAWNEDRMKVDDYIEFVISVRELEDKYGIKLMKKNY